MCLKNQQKQEVSAVPTDSTAQEIGEIAKFVHQSPIIAIFIILLLFILALIALLGVGIPYAKKFFNNNFNHFGSDKNGNKITHSQMQQRQLEYERRNYRILVELGERAGLKFSKEAKDDVLF